MAKEIERKFMVKDGSYMTEAENSVEIAQGYLSIHPDRTVRVRIAGERGFMTVKTRNVGAVRGEWEFEIPIEDAREILSQAAVGVLSKTRYYVPSSDGFTWEIDKFHGSLEGLAIAEIELPDEQTPFALPPFAGKEVTGDPRYYNSNLATQV